MVNFITSMQDELHSGTKLNSGIKAIRVSKLIKSSLCEDLSIKGLEIFCFSTYIPDIFLNDGMNNNPC